MDHPTPTTAEPSIKPRRHYFPVIATYAILVLNILTFLLMTGSGGSKNVNVLLNFGASYGPYFRDGEYWRLVMPMFLHIGWEHLIGNMLALWLLGSFLEPLYGYGRFSLLYVLSGMGGSLLSMEASQHIAAGASGAILGIAGAMLMTGMLHPETVPRRWKMIFGLGIGLLIAINLVFGHFVRHIDNWAHLGGLVSGMALAWIIPPAPAAARTNSAQPIVVLPLAIVLLAAGATADHSLKTKEVDVLLGAAARLEVAGHAARAKQSVEEANRVAPRDPRVQEAMGAEYLRDKEYDLAIRELSEAVRVNPYSEGDAVRLAAAYEGKGDFTRARAVLEASNRLMPGKVAVLEALGELCFNLKQYATSIQYYHQVLKINPNSAASQNNLAWLYATCKDLRYRNSEKAKQHALHAVQLTHGRQPDFIDTLAAAYYASQEYRRAAEAESRAAQLDPQNPIFQQNLVRYRTLAGK